jgi:tRNA pseudouridine55 synthase
LELHGVLVVDKPAGPTSHDVVDRARRIVRTRRVGHTGTLDPFASGILPLCIGKATRLARFFSGHDKSYTATVRFGFATTTDDVEGEPLGPAAPFSLDAVALEDALGAFRGEIDQLPPAFSAKRTDGRRHHELARAGLPVERRPCRVTIRSLALQAVAEDRAEIEVTCSPGTYIRALARDLGERIGSGGHLVSLRRTRSGPFTLADAVPLGDLSEAAALERLVPLAELLPDFPAVCVDERGLAALRHGRDLTRPLVVSGFPDAPPPARLRILDAAGSLVALAEPRGFLQTVPGLSVEPVLHPDIVLMDQTS